MHSALIQTMRSYAACHLTTAHQRHPTVVPLVLYARSTQTTTHLVDIIQTVSRTNSILSNRVDYTIILPIVLLKTIVGDRRISFSFIMKNSRPKASVSTGINDFMKSSTLDIVTMFHLK